MVPMLREVADELASSFGADALAWAFIYVEEAHAVDEWPISSPRYTPTGRPVAIPQHKSLDDRAAAAAAFDADFPLGFPLYLDDMDNAFQTAYGAWPLRFYIIHNGILVYKAEPAECTYSISDFRDAAAALLNSLVA